MFVSGPVDTDHAVGQLCRPSGSNMAAIIVVTFGESRPGVLYHSTDPINSNQKCEHIASETSIRGQSPCRYSYYRSWVAVMSGPVIY